MTPRLLLIGTLSLPAVSLVLGASPAMARAASSEGSADEETYLERGVDLRKKGDDEAALHEFRRAYEVSKSGRALAQVALAEQALGHWVDAETHLTEALSHEKEAWIARNKGALGQSLSDIKGHLGSLQLSGGVPHAEVRVNGLPAGELPLTAPLRVLSGSVAIEVRAPGYLPVVRTVFVAARGLSREQVVMVPAAASEVEASPSEVAPRRTAPPAREGQEPSIARHENGGSGWGWARTTGVVLSGVGVLGLGAGVGFLLQRENRASAFNATCSYDGKMVIGGAGCLSKYNDVQTSQRLTIAGFVGGGVFLATGLAFLIFGGGESSTTQAAHSPPGASRWACAPSGNLGAACAVTF